MQIQDYLFYRLENHDVFQQSIISKILVHIDGLEYPFRTDQKTALINIVNKFNSKTIVIYFTFFVLQEEIY